MNKTLRIFIFSIVLALLGAGQANAAISVYPGTARGYTGNNNIAPPTPTEAMVGDVLIAQIVAKNSARITAPTGWTLVSSASKIETSGTGVQQNIYYLNLSSAPAASYTWTLSGNSTRYSSALIFAVRGAKAADCGATSTSNCAGAVQSGGGNQITAPNIQSQPPTYSAGSLRMAFFASDYGDGWIYPNLENSATASPYYYSYYLNTRSDYLGVGMAGSYYLLQSVSNGGNQTAGMNATSGIGSTFVLEAGTTTPMTCLTDSFDPSVGLKTDTWATARVNGSFTPSVTSDGRLRLTNTGTQESTAVSLQRLLPGASNYIQLTFKYYGYGGSGNADGIAVILSDANVTPQPGGFGGSLGYAPKGSVPGFTGGWLGLGLDEYGNFSNRNDSGPCATGVSPCATSAVQQSVSLRGSAPNYYWLKGTGTLGTSVSNSTGHLYRVTIDSSIANQAMVKVERDTTGSGNNYNTLLSSFNAATANGQSAIPANFILSLTGSTGDSTNNHEIDDLQICAQHMNPIVAIDHYEFTVKDTALTCTPAKVRVRACMDAACSTTYSGNATVKLLPAGAWVGGDTKTFPGSGADFTLSETTAGTYTLGVVSSSSSPAMKAFTTNPALCSIAGGAVSSNCNLTFSDSGLWYDVPALTSGKTSAAITITAAKTDTSVTPNKGDLTNRCIPAFVGSRNIKFWSSYVSPDSTTITGTPPPALTMNSTVLSTTSASPSTVPLIFDATGQATFTLNYPDAGELSLNARYDGSTSTNDNGLKLLGSSTFAVVPAGLCVDSTDTGWSCTKTDLSTCSLFKQAGQKFNMQVSAVAWKASDICTNPTVTPNFALSMSPTPAFMITSTLKAPTDTGTQNASLGVTSFNLAPSDKGIFTTQNQTVSEVGVFNLTAALNNTGTPPVLYFGQTIPSIVNPVSFGRFRPAYFTTTVTPACGPVGNLFTYSGQPFTTTVTAMNALSGSTANYTGAFAYDVTLSNAGNTANFKNNLITASTFKNGIAKKTDVTYTFPPVLPNDPNGNGNTVLTLRAIDADAKTGVGGWAGVSSLGHEGLNRVQTGRVRLLNAYGTELLNLPVKMTTERYNGTAWELNTADTCSKVTLTFATPPGSTDITGKTCVLDNGVAKGKSGQGCTTAALAGLQFIQPTDTGFSGNYKLTLQKPGAGNIGSVDITAVVDAWMQYPWSSSSKTNPKSRATFGKKSNSPVIYLREIY